MKYQCPVCGYPDLDDEPVNHEICRCCGTQFGYDDYLRSHEELRREWVANGANWFLAGYEPQGWDPYDQLYNAFLEIEETSGTKTNTASSVYQQVTFEVVRYPATGLRTTNVIYDLRELLNTDAITV